MACNKAQEIAFIVHELYPDGRKAEGKILTVSKAENDELGYSVANGYAEGIDKRAIVLILFRKLYNFTIGPNGFQIKWDIGCEENYGSGVLYWPGPLAQQAIKCGGSWWRIKRIS